MSLGDQAESLRMTGAELRERLSHELSVIDWRALIVVVVAESGLEREADQAYKRASAAHRISGHQVLEWAVRRDEAGREQLRVYNRGRDSFVAEKRLIYLRASSAADVRFLREVAPDLTSSIDVFVELRGETQEQGSWEECSRTLRALMEDRHGTLDFTGLLPASVDQRVLPLDELYQPLVELSTVADLLKTAEGLASRGWLVLGHPGTGKTTFVRHLAWTYAREADDPLEIGPKVPILVSLSDYGYERGHDRVRSLVEFLRGWLAEQQVAHASALTDHLPEVLLLLDGLDELRSPETRRSVLAEVNDLLREGRVGGVVITGRSFLVDELGKRDQALRVVMTKAPSAEQIRAFVQAFVRLRRGAGTHAEQLIKAIEGDPDLSALARTPLMLAFMVILDELEGRLPDRRIEIYYRLGEMLIDRWTRARSIGASSSRHERPTRADALRVVGPLAWWTLESGGAVSEDELLREIERLEARRETPAEASRRAAALLELLRSDMALLVPVPGRRWRFVHQSVGEYFAGVEVERDRERWDRLLADPFRAEWREIVLFCAGQLGVIEGRMERLDRLIEAVLRKSRRAGRYDAKYASLLIGLLAESPGLSRRQVDRLVGRLLAFVFTFAYSINSLLQIQADFVALLRNARGIVREGLRKGLRELFSNRFETIRWDRILDLEVNKSIISSHWPNFRIRTVAQAFLGHFAASLGEPWLADYRLNLKPTLEHWSTHDRWPYRFAIWWLRSDPDLHDRPFAEIADQIPD